MLLVSSKSSSSENVPAIDEKETEKKNISWFNCSFFTVARSRFRCFSAKRTVRDHKLAFFHCDKISVNVYASMWNKHYLLYLYGIITFALSILQHNVSGSGLLQDISLTLCVFSVPYTIKLRHNKTELSIYRSQAIRSQTTHPFSVFREPALPSFLSYHSVTEVLASRIFFRPRNKLHHKIKGLFEATTILHDEIHASV